MHTVERIVARALGRIGVERGESVLVALSGGPDSVALLRALVALAPQWEMRLSAAHFNHGLRAEESQRDERFVRALCVEIAVPLTVETASGLYPTMPNLEERARVSRLDFLRRVAASRQAKRIALGHNRDDQAETILMRLIRGAGIRGLKGMAEAGPGNLIRPLLGATRREILSYLSEIDAAWVADSSNSSPERLRNRIRHDLIPLLESQFACGLSGRLCALGVEMERLDRLVTALASGELERRLVTADALGVESAGPEPVVANSMSDSTVASVAVGGLDISGVGELPQALVAAMIREFIARSVGSLRRVERSHVDAVVHLSLFGPPNGLVNLPGHLIARRQYQLLLLERSFGAKPTAQAFDVTLNVPGVTVVEPAQVRFDASLGPADGAVPMLPPDEAWFDASELGDGLRVRNFRPGDRLTIMGDNSSRKLKHLFRERHIPRPRRANFPVVTLNGEIVWVPGLARSRRALVRAQTSTVLKLRARSLIARRQTPMLAFNQVRLK